MYKATERVIARQTAYGAVAALLQILGITGPIYLVIALGYCGVPTVAVTELAAVVAYLVALGADPDAKDRSGENIFDRANYSCPPEVMKALIG